MKLPSFQEHLLPATLKTNLDLYEYFVPSGGWLPVTAPGHYQQIRELVPGRDHTLNSVHVLEAELIHLRVRESDWIHALRCATDGDVYRPTVNQRLRALARCLEESPKC